ncbi:hypothetical protein [Escherichia phage vB_EcoM_JNE01]|nr:hypothetical protein [Escherichia phage vB_EcoM_JNE01]
MAVLNTPNSRWIKGVVLTDFGCSYPGWILDVDMSSPPEVWK